MSQTVSVIIPAYNAERTIAETLRGCLNQTVAPLEILVVDDGSVDRTAEIVASFPAPVRLLRKPNGGPASARNLGAREARGDWLALLDADDHWLPTKLERQLQRDTAPDIGVIHALLECSRPGTPAEVKFEHLWEHNWISNSSVLIRRSVFEAVGGFDEDRRLISVEDYNLWLRVAHAGWRIVTCNEILLRYTRGIGISSHTEKFFKANIDNIQLVGERLELPPEMVREKLAKMYAFFGDVALHERNMRLARQAHKHATRLRPSARNIVHLAASQFPSGAFDMRRHLVDSWGELRDKTATLGIGAEGEIEADIAAKGPFLIVVVDTEEEFDWSVVPSQSTSVQSMRHQHLTQRIFDKFGIVPIYAVDYAVASQRDGYEPLLEFLADGKCEIGTHLHPWINPPIEESLTMRNSYPGNLPSHLEYEKLKALTEIIRKNLGYNPTVYRAGRYGVGPNTFQSLKRLGYKIDCSVLPMFDLTHMEGPDFRKSRTKPYWVDPERDLLEIPVTVGVIGALSVFGRHLHPLISSPRKESLRLPGVFARLNLINRVRLTPEGVPLHEAKQLTRTLLNESDHRVFVLSYHSPSLQPGNTPYVRSARDLQRFLHWIETYAEYFVSELGGTVTTPTALLAMTKPQSGEAESLPRPRLKASRR